MNKELEKLRKFVCLFVENISLISKDLTEKSNAICYAELVAKDEVVLWK